MDEAVVLVRSRLEKPEQVERIAINVFLDVDVKEKLDELMRQTGSNQRDTIAAALDALEIVLREAL